MDRKQALAVNGRLLEHVERGSTDLADKEMRVPADVYSCPRRFAAEKNALFRNTPQPVAFSAELAETGCFLALEILGIPLLLTRAESGQINAFVNSCSHRGAKVATGKGHSRRLVCPFHGWAYSLDGDLVGRPGDEHFASGAAQCALAQLPVSEKFGIVVVGLNQGVRLEDVESALEGVGEELASYRLQHYRSLDRRIFQVRANWKLVTELSLESYHFRTLHRDSVSAVLESNAVVDTLGVHSRWAFPLKSIVRLRDIDQDDWPDFVEGSVTYTLYPGVMLIVNAAGAQMIRAEPGDVPGHSRVFYAGVYPPDAEVEDARGAYDFGGDVFEREDLPVAEGCQQGVAARHRDMVFGRNEVLLQFWHRQWSTALG